MELERCYQGMSLEQILQKRHIERGGQPAKEIPPREWQGSFEVDTPPQQMSGDVDKTNKITH